MYKNYEVHLQNTRQWKKKNAERVKAYNKKYYAQNKEKFAKRARKLIKDGYYKEWYKNNKFNHNEAVKKWKRNNPEKAKQYSDKSNRTLRGLWRRYRQSANRYDRDFNLTMEEFEKIVTQPCLYCGDEEERWRGVDRFDNSKGYIKGNCVPCCTWCNYIKRDRSVEEFFHQITKIYEYTK